jgi:hypothetical protein
MEKVIYMEIEQISIAKFENDLTKLIKEYNAYADVGKIVHSVRERFISKFSRDNHDIEIGSLHMTNEDNHALHYNVNSYAEAKKILSKYVTNSFEQKLGQNYISLSNVVFDSEAKKINKDSRSFRNTQPPEVLRQIMLKKTEKNIPIHVGLDVHSYKSQRNIEDLFMMITNTVFVPVYMQYGESVKQFESRINKENPELEIKVTSTGLMRFTFKNPVKHQALREYLINKEMDYILNRR